MKKNSRILIAGGSSAVGTEIYKKLQHKGYNNIISPPHSAIDLTKPIEVERLFKCECFDYVFLVAAHVKSISENKKHPADIFLKNLSIQNNVLHCCYTYGIKRTVFFSSLSALPAIAGRTLSEEDLSTASLSKHLEPYALAKLCGTKLCTYLNTEAGENRFISLLPCHIYGGMKNTSLVFSLIDDIHKAMEQQCERVILWGAPNARYQLLHAGDVADASLLLMEKPVNHDIYNVCGNEVYTKLQIAEMIRVITGFRGEFYFDVELGKKASIECIASSNRIKELGWSQRIELEEGLAMMYEEYLKQVPSVQ